MILEHCDNPMNLIHRSTEYRDANLATYFTLISSSWQLFEDFELDMLKKMSAKFRV